IVTLHHIHSNDQLSTLTSSNLLVCLFTSPPDGPQRLSVSVSPSAKMLEGGSVTLTCSADANPAASYTWYKQDGTSDPHLLSKEPHLVFSSIQSSDSGNYSCTAENQLGRNTSDFISIDRPSVSVCPSAEMLEGGSVTLTCSTDANPAASYTWYKEHEDSPRASGQIFTITNFTAEHSGNYYCEAQNEMGRSNSTLLLITESGEFLHDRNRLINKQHLLHVKQLELILTELLL
uniref:Ig-like domain-containing protein n=1 Tax=Gasterosteus aculeatus aculeatus TaxID=481459 RepID=A0AAQ4RFY3_GASAC